MIEIIRSLPLVLFLVILFFPIVLTAALIGAWLQARGRAALITATPTAHIGMAQDGYREFEGRIEAVGGTSIEASLTRWPCVWYHASVERFSSGSGSKRSPSWTTVKDVTSSAPFFIRDSTGVCLVEPGLAEVTPTDKSVWYGATEVPTDRNPAKVGPTESAGTVEIAGGSNSQFRYSEERIYAGDPLLVLGEFVTARRAAAAAADEDADLEDVEEGDEAIDPEAEAALTDEDRESIAEEEVADRLREQSEATTRAWIGRGSGAQPFLLSTTLQAVHVAQTSMGAQGFLTGAAVMAAIGVLLLWARFG